MTQVFSVKEIVSDSKLVYFTHYKSGELWYIQPETNFDFPVPIEDAGEAFFYAKDKALLFMKWIRKHHKYLEDARKEHEQS